MRDGYFFILVKNTGDVPSLLHVHFPRINLVFPLQDCKSTFAPFLFKVPMIWIALESSGSVYCLYVLPFILMKQVEDRCFLFCTMSLQVALIDFPTLSSRRVRISFKNSKG